jgi:L-rhamnose mutarotase
MQRYAMICGLKPEGEAKYRESHAACWPAVLDTIRQCNIRNYSIFLRGGVLYSYFEYVGDDFAADMARMAVDQATQQWWGVVKPLMLPLPDRREGEFWAPMEEIFHTD